MVHGLLVQPPRRINLGYVCALVVAAVASACISCIFLASLDDPAAALFAGEEEPRAEVLKIVASDGGGDADSLLLDK